MMRPARSTPVVLCVAALVSMLVATATAAFYQVSKSDFLSCYSPVPGQDNTTVVLPMAFNNADRSVLCARYQFKCGPGDITCSQQEITNRVEKWYYVTTTKEACSILPMAGAKRVLCCSTDNCNKPDPDLDPDTAKETAEAEKKTLSCLTPAPGTSTGAGALLIPFVLTSPDMVCVRYRYQCKAKDAICSDAEEKAGTLKWTYVAISKAACSIIEADNSTYQESVCCDTPNCNTPDPALDPDSQVFLPAV